MPINKLELPEWKQSPMVDWSPLAKIGEAIQERRRQARIRDVVEGARDADGHVSLARLGESLAAAGEVDPGIRAIYLGERQRALDAQARRAAATRAAIDRQETTRAQRTAEPSNVPQSAGTMPATMPPPYPADRWPPPAGYTGAPGAQDVRDAMKVGLDDPAIAGPLRAYGIHPSELHAAGDAREAGARVQNNGDLVQSLLNARAAIHSGRLTREQAIQKLIGGGVPPALANRI
jgi:hypothetical protein